MRRLCHQKNNSGTFAAATLLLSYGLNVLASSTAATPNFVTLVAVGDNLFSREMIMAGKQNGMADYTSFFTEVKPLVEKADIAFVNQETVLVPKSLGHGDFPLFGTPFEVGLALVDTGFNVVNHGSNHALDKGIEGIEATLDFWDMYPNVTVLGIHRSEEMRRRQTIVERNSVKVGFLSYTGGLNVGRVPKHRPYLVSIFDYGRIAKEVNALRPNCDVLIVSVHMGTEFGFQHNAEQERCAHFLADLNVDIVIGHHPHVIEDACFLPRRDGGNTFCAYSLGNFMGPFGDKVDPTRVLLGGLMYARIKVDSGVVTIKDAGVLPLVFHYEGKYVNAKVYPLFAYTEELAAKHLRRIQGWQLSPVHFAESAKSALGDFMLKKDPFFDFLSKSSMNEMNPLKVTGMKNRQLKERNERPKSFTSISSIFGDNMVLQRGKSVPVWGSACPSKLITVLFAGQIKTTTTNKNGTWSVVLDPLKASATPAELTVTTRDGDTQYSDSGRSNCRSKGGDVLTIKNVVVGEVWLCSGQSNMHIPLKQTANGSQEVADATHPGIRLMQVKKTFSDEPQTDFVGTYTSPSSPSSSAWSPCTPDSARIFSAVGYFFGRDVAAVLGVPVGLIDASWNGTVIEGWTSILGLTSSPAFALRSIGARVETATPGTILHTRLAKQMLATHSQWLADAHRDLKAHRRIAEPPSILSALLPLSGGITAQDMKKQPTLWYNAMVAPLTPYALRGAIWYQGEANVQLDETAVYYEKMQALVSSWRVAFNNPEMPVHFVQVAPYRYNRFHVLPEFWQAQTRFAQENPSCGMVIINDIGSVNDIHPPNKQLPGKRLALHALCKTYGMAAVKCESPSPAYTRGNTIQFRDGAAVIRFENAERLDTRDGGSPTWFELAGADGLFYPAVAEITDVTTVIVRAVERVPNPMAVRFAWDERAEPNLRNEAGLPARPFISDDVPVRTLLDKFVPEAALFEIAYSLDTTRSSHKVITHPLSKGGEIKRLAFFLHTVRKLDKSSFAFVSMNPFESTLTKYDPFPNKRPGGNIQQVVTNVSVKSNFPGLKTGLFKYGKIKYEDCGYSMEEYSFRLASGYSLASSSMQIEVEMEASTNSKKKVVQTILAYRKQRRGAGWQNCELGLHKQLANINKHENKSKNKNKNPLVGQLLVLVMIK